MVKLAMAIRQLILVLSTSVILCLVMFAAAWWYFGSAKASWAYFRGESLYVDEPHKVIQPVTAGELGTITFVLQNLKSRPITIHGINASCNCVMAESLPLKIEARDKHSFNFKARNHENQAGSTTVESATLLYDPPGVPVVLRMTVPISGKVDGAGHR